MTAVPQEATSSFTPPHLQVVEAPTAELTPVFPDDTIVAAVAGAIHHFSEDEVMSRRGLLPVPELSRSSVYKVVDAMLEKQMLVEIPCQSVGKVKRPWNNQPALRRTINFGREMAINPLWATAARARERTLDTENAV